MAARQPEKVLLLRSGRHLRVAMDALAARFPGCRIGVVGTPGSEAAITTADVLPGDAFIYSGRRLQPLAFFFSATAMRVRAWRYDRVAILWNDPDGTGQGNVDRTAFALSPRGYLAITPDGTIVERSPWPQLRVEALRVGASLAVGSALALLLYVPAIVSSAVRRLTGPAKAGHYVGPDAPVMGAAFRRPGH
jgi:hypothetical protein